MTRSACKHVLAAGDTLLRRMAAERSPSRELAPSPFVARYALLRYEPSHDRRTAELSQGALSLVLQARPARKRAFRRRSTWNGRSGGVVRLIVGLQRATAARAFRIGGCVHGSARPEGHVRSQGRTLFGRDRRARSGIRRRSCDSCRRARSCFGSPPVQVDLRSCRPRGR